MVRIIERVTKPLRRSIISGRNIVEASPMGHISTKKAAELTGFEMAYIRQLLLRGKLNGRKFGRDWQVSQASVDKYLATRKRRGRPPKD